MFSMQNSPGMHFFPIGFSEGGLAIYMIWLDIFGGKRRWGRSVTKTRVRRPILVYAVHSSKRPISDLELMM